MEELKKITNVICPARTRLSHAQKRLWDKERKYLNKVANNIGGTVKVLGDVDFKVLEQAINHFIRTNEGIRLSFVEQEGEVYQYVTEYEMQDIDFYDFSLCENPEQAFKKWVEEETKKTLLIADGIMFYFAMFRVSDDNNGYFFKINHIIADGWSVSLLLQQIEQIYTKIVNNEECDFGSKPSYLDYIDRENNYLTSAKFDKNKTFWNEMYKYIPQELLFKDSCKAEGKRKVFTLNKELSNRLRNLISDNKLSMNSFFVALYFLYLNRITGQKDIVIGTPVLNRSGKTEKETFGMFVSTMPFRYYVSENKTAIENIEIINNELINCYFNQRYPYDLLTEDLDLNSKGFDSLFSVFVNYYNTKLNSEFNGIPIVGKQLYCGSQEEPLQIIINEWSTSGELTIYFDYRISDFTERQIDFIYSKMITLLKAIIAEPNEKVSSFHLSMEIEKTQLIYDFFSARYELMRKKVVDSVAEKVAFG